MTRQLYRCAGPGLVRSVAHADLRLPAWPDLTDTTPERAERWREWLQGVWVLDGVATALGHASPELAIQVEAICAGQCPSPRRVRRMVLSMMRYLLRMTGRATPFGLFAGVAGVEFTDGASARWGGAHSAVVRAGAAWLADVVVRLESCPALLERLPVVANNVCFRRGRRLVVPYQPQPDGRGSIAAVEVSLNDSDAVRLVMDAARTPVRCGALAGKLAAEYPTAAPSVISGLLGDLVARRALVSSLHAPSIVTDSLGHLIDQLDAAGAGEVPAVADTLLGLREIQNALAEHSSGARTGAGAVAGIAGRMRTISPASRQPLAVDLRLDCDLALPRAVAADAEAAASVLARLTALPFGTQAWREYHTRFFERFGAGALVPLLDVVDPDVGLGFPAGYPGADPEPRVAVTARDERLLTLAQAAALDGRAEVALDEALIAELAAADLERVEIPPHLELCFAVEAQSLAALGRGEFRLVVVGMSRGAGTMTGRFLSVLAAADRQRLAGALAQLPAGDSGALRAQLSFPPLSPAAAHVTRVAPVLPAVLSLAEHPASQGETAVGLEDLAVGCDSHRMYLASLTTGRQLEPALLHALDLSAHTPPLARFLAEIGRAQSAVVGRFDWGAADRLPFLPRVRYRRMVLAPARWLLDPADLPGQHAPWVRWQEALAGWRARRQVPDFVYLGRGDRRLRLDLREPSHLALLRAELRSAGSASLAEAPGPGVYGWFGERAHEIVIPLSTTRTPRPARASMRAGASVIRRDHGHLPGMSRWLYAKLHGHPDRHAEILADRLATLLSTWGTPPIWWFVRYRDPRPHLRLRIALLDPADFGPAAHRLSTWAARLRQLGLLHDLELATYYPETGRWGDGPAMAAAEAMFAADSHAVLAQFAQPAGPHPHALAAANFVSIAAAFTGSTAAGMAWLIDQTPAETRPAMPRPVLAEAVHLADPAEDWAALRTTSGGPAIVAAWHARQAALADYRRCLALTGHADPDAVLSSVLHGHHMRAAGVDPDGERVSLRLARAAALAHQARRVPR
jgi:thiopeptide-type bacteriocin biosynthesis protein